MTGRRFLVVIRVHGRDQCAICEDELPSKSMLRGTQLVYRLELLGKWRAMSVDEVAAEYRRRRMAGTLPADNTVKAPARKRARA